MWIRFLQFRGNRPGSGCDAAKWKLRKFRAFQIVFCLNNLFYLYFFQIVMICCISNCICWPSFLVLFNVSLSVCIKGQVMQPIKKYFSTRSQILKFWVNEMLNKNLPGLESKFLSITSWVMSNFFLSGFVGCVLN